MTPNEIEEGKLQVEQGKLKVAQDTLSLEHEKYQFQSGLQNKTLGLEEKKFRRTSHPIVVATVVAVAGFLANAVIENWKASNEFKLKAAEIVMNSSGVAATKERSEALQKLFPQELSDKFATALQVPEPKMPDRPDLEGDPEQKKALIGLLAEHPAQREQIIRDWSAVFTDKWPKCLQTPNPCQ